MLTKITDLDLQESVAEELSFDPSVDASHIGVAAKDGVVTLTGRVSTYAEKIAAEEAAKRVAGVKRLACELSVDLPAFHQRTDADIIAAALNVLSWDVSIPEDAVKVQAENGWLTLDGAVDWPYQKEHAEHAVRQSGRRARSHRSHRPAAASVGPGDQRETPGSVPAARRDGRRASLGRDARCERHAAGRSIRGLNAMMRRARRSRFPASRASIILP